MVRSPGLGKAGDQVAAALPGVGAGQCRRGSGGQWPMPAGHVTARVTGGRALGCVTWPAPLAQCATFATADAPCPASESVLAFNRQGSCLQWTDRRGRPRRRPV